MKIKIDEAEFELPATIGRYEIGNMIGEGAFSVVVEVRTAGSDMTYACKVCSRKVLLDSGLWEKFEQEVRILEILRHPNLVALLDVVYDPELVYLVMEHCRKGDMFQYIVDHGPFNSETSGKLFNQIVSAMVYVHRHDIAHRDLKPENILLDDDLNAKISDFGLCHAVVPNELLSTPCGTLSYAPPELLEGKAYDGKKADVWSLGVVLYALSASRLPWSGRNEMVLIAQIKQCEIRLPPLFCEQLKSLIRRMLNVDPEQRPTMLDVAQDPWVRLYEQEGVPQGSVARSLRMNANGGNVKVNVRKQIVVRPIVMSAQVPKGNSGYIQRGSRRVVVRHVPISNSKLIFS